MRSSAPTVGSSPRRAPDLDRVVAVTVPRDGDWLPKYVQVSVAAVLAGHRAAAEMAYQLLSRTPGNVPWSGILAGSWGSVAAHLGLLARYLGRAEDAGAHFALAAELDAAAGAALAARTREWAGGDGSAPDGAAVFRLDGEVWTLRYADRTVRLRDSKGLRDLAVLLARPGEQTHVERADRRRRAPRVRRPARWLTGARSRPTGSGCAGSTPSSTRLDAGSAEAGTLNHEREALLAELSATTGLGGRRRAAGSPAERMRKAVTYRIRHADLPGHRRASRARPAPAGVGAHRYLVQLLPRTPRRLAAVGAAAARLAPRVPN